MDDNMNIDEMNKLINSIKSGCPVHKINFNIYNKNCVVGYALVVNTDIDSYLKKICDMDDLDDNTILVFESRHVMECLQIIYGALYMARLHKSVNIPDYSGDIIDTLIDITLSKPIRYSKFKSRIKSLLADTIHGYDKKILNNCCEIIKRVWFVPYKKIDDIAVDSVKEYNENTKEEIKNE